MSYSATTFSSSNGFDFDRIINSLFVETFEDNDNSNDDYVSCSDAGSDVCNSDLFVDVIGDLPLNFDNSKEECNDERQKLKNDAITAQATLFTLTLALTF